MSTNHLMAQAAQEKENFLLPNATIFVETIIFLVVLFIFFRFIVPPIRKAMRERNEMVQRSLDESRQAEEKFRQAEERYQQALSEARAEAARIRDVARAEWQKTLDELRARANAEIAELRKQAAEQLGQERERVLADLEPTVHGLASDLAGRVVGEGLGGNAGRKGAR
jgi:F-type H+-transporting ATPase subunit b